MAGREVLLLLYSSTEPVICNSEMYKPIIGILFFSLLLMLTSGEPCAHPFKASICEINYNAETEHLEITLKLFTDDLEECVRDRARKSLYLDTEKELPSAGFVINDYIQSDFRIVLNGKQVSLDYLGKEHEPGTTWCYFESTEGSYPSELSVYNSIMTELYPTQSNIVHVQVGKKRKSLLLGPERPSGTVKFQE